MQRRRSVDAPATVGIVTPQDVKQLQADVRSFADPMSRAIYAWALEKNNASDPLVEQWAAMRARVDTFLAQEPSWIDTGQQMDAGQAIQRDLLHWWDVLNARGVRNLPPKPNPPPAPGDLFGSLKEIITMMIVLALLREFGK